MRNYRHGPSGRRLNAAEMAYFCATELPIAGFRGHVASMSRPGRCRRASLMGYLIPHYPGDEALVVSAGG